MTTFVAVATVLLLACPAIGPRPAAAAQQPGSPAPPPQAPATGLSGYMDFHFNKVELEDGRLDFHRFVLLVTHRFSDRIRFVGELEVEHALVEGLEDAGELELEQAYVDFLLKRAVRSGSSTSATRRRSTTGSSGRSSIR
jgi:hypothetical protein